MKYFLKKLLTTIVVLFFSSVAIFLIIHIIPGDPAELMGGPGVTDTDIQRIREGMGLDKPLVTQYLIWIGDIMHGDFGRSLLNNEPIFPLLSARFYNTFILAVFSIAITIIFGVPFGIISAIKQNSIFDVTLMVLSIIGISLPIFWLGLILIMTFSVNLNWLPATGYGSFKHLILPGIAIAANSLALVARMTRSSMLEVLRQDYMRTAESKGLPSQVIIVKHALKNSFIPIVTTIGIQFGYLLGGAVLTETVFVYPGLGRLLVESIGRRDYAVIQGCMLVIAAMCIVINLLVDLTYKFLDPRIKQ